MWQLKTSLAGFGAKTRDGQPLHKEIFKEIREIINKLVNDDNEPEFDITKAYYEYEALRDKKDRTEEETQRMNELKTKMNEHIDEQINRLRKVGEKQKQKQPHRR